ncbi:nucleotidyl cyclase domain-containing protein [Salimicrobium flavidum]|uniref:GGDEF domain-containing protein n=1 Tax=Salimicrobium flavidum TaxID=570947 RepID=A0A1N7JCP0_9BACI|nr:hypothetical protein [Salimicrobium flavidum]SIS47021.1 hypothetical protein SAMN05421687_10519 [Salimicrobium flavidum]
MIVLHRSHENCLEWAEEMSEIFSRFSAIASLSYGAVEYKGNIRDIPTLLNEADKHMYERKKSIKERKHREERKL